MRKIVSIISAAAVALPAAVVLPVATALPIAVAAPTPASAFGFLDPDFVPGIGTNGGAGAHNYRYHGCYHHERTKGHTHQRAEHLCGYLR